MDWFCTTEVESVYRAVRCKPLYKRTGFFFKGLQRSRVLLRVLALKVTQSQDRRSQNYLFCAHSLCLCFKRCQNKHTIFLYAALAKCCLNCVKISCSCKSNISGRAISCDTQIVKRLRAKVPKLYTKLQFLPQAKGIQSSRERPTR